MSLNQDGRGGQEDKKTTIERQDRRRIIALNKRKLAIERHDRRRRIALNKRTIT